jgi:hypothetical protein
MAVSLPQAAPSDQRRTSSGSFAIVRGYPPLFVAGHEGGSAPA